MGIVAGGAIHFTADKAFTGF
jgi:hypothetical protein